MSIARQMDSELYTTLHEINSGTTTTPHKRSLAAKLKRNKFVFVRRYFIFQAKTNTRIFATVINKAVRARKEKMTFDSVLNVKSLVNSIECSAERLSCEAFSVSWPILARDGVVVE